MLEVKCMGYGFGGGCGKGCQSQHNKGNTFELIVVLFILLIIVGTTFYR